MLIGEWTALVRFWSPSCCSVVVVGRGGPPGVVRMTVTGAGVRVLEGREGGERGAGESVSRSPCMPACVWATLILGDEEAIVEGVAGLDGTDSGTCSHTHRER